MFTSKRDSHNLEERYVGQCYVQLLYKYDSSHWSCEWDDKSHMQWYNKWF